MSKRITDRPFVTTTPGGKPVEHGGSGAAYSNYGCRCEPCTVANTERTARGRLTEPAPDASRSQK